MPDTAGITMKASGFLHWALRSPDPIRIGKFYADLFECGFFIHPILSGLGVVIVKIANPKSVFRGILATRYPLGRCHRLAAEDPRRQRPTAKSCRLSGAEWVENLVSIDEHAGRCYPVASEA